jgi:hypothetical protein
MASYIARDVATVPSRSGIDGGMNPVFLAKLSTHDGFDNDGRSYKLAGNSQAPGALPRTSAPPAATAELGQDAQPVASPPVVMASVRMPQPAPQAKEGEAPPEQPKSITGLLGNLFGSAPAEAKPTEPATDGQAVALRGSKTEMAAKPKRATPVRTASTPVAPQPKPHEAVATNAPAPAPRAQQARREASATPAPEMRTAYSTPPASNSGLLSGAQPVVPAGTFENRWTALR